MERRIFTASRIREVLLDGRWIANTNYKDQITNTKWEDAIKKVGNLNTIAALTYHINYYMAGLLEAFATGKLTIKDAYSFDLPPIKSKEAWDMLIESFLLNAEKFVAYVENIPDEKLDEIFIAPKYGTFYRNIEGVIEHSYYHLGQISLIRKLLASSI